MGFCVKLVSKKITEDAISKKNKYHYIISWKKVTEPGVAFRCMENASKYWNSENGKQILQKRRIERKEKRIQRQNGQPNEESFCEEPPDTLCTFDAQGGFCQGEICIGSSNMTKEELEDWNIRIQQRQSENDITLEQVAQKSGLTLERLLQIVNLYATEEELRRYEDGVNACINS
jgi:hypothetical protein